MLDKNVKHILVNTGQNYNYELNKIFFKNLNIKEPGYNLSFESNTSAIESVSKILIQVEKILIKEKPNAIIVLGDTNSCLSAYAAKRLKIPIFILRPVIDVMIKEFQRKLIEKLLIIYLI